MSISRGGGFLVSVHEQGMHKGKEFWNRALPFRRLGVLSSLSFFTKRSWPCPSLLRPPRCSKQPGSGLEDNLTHDREFCQDDTFQGKYTAVAQYEWGHTKYAHYVTVKLCLNTHPPVPRRTFWVSCLLSCDCSPPRIQQGYD